MTTNKSDDDFTGQIIEGLDAYLHGSSEEPGHLNVLSDGVMVFLQFTHEGKMLFAELPPADAIDYANCILRMANECR